MELYKINSIGTSYFMSSSGPYSKLLTMCMHLFY